MSEGKKFDSDKPRLDLLPVISLVEVAKVLGMGADKYGAYNWTKGIKYSRILAGILRHVFSYIGGESIDPESGISHIAHAACGCLFILHYEKYKAEFDDRAKEVYNENRSGAV